MKLVMYEETYRKPYAKVQLHQCIAANIAAYNFLSTD